MPPDLDWVRRVNRSWLTRGNLAGDAAGFLDALAAEPARLAAACRLARAFTRSGRADEDPKPRFYAALFFHATAAERQRFLAAHPFTRAVLAGPDEPAAAFAPETRAAIRRLQTELQACAGTVA
jgi:hypothetical protein